jgi:hypothetical protein
VEVFKSVKGYQQGCGLGTFSCSARTFPFLKCLASLTSGFIKGFVDMIDCLATHQECFAVLKFIVDEWLSYGLFLQPTKTEILIGECSNEEKLTQDYNGYMSVLNIDE